MQPTNGGCPQAGSLAGQWYTSCALRTHVRSHARTQDNSDHQYRGFRNNLPALSGLVALFFAAKAFYTRAAPSRADRVPFYVGIALVVLGILHGTGALKVLALVLANYALTRAGAGRPWFVPALWAWNGAVLFANERWRGYEGAFGALHPGLAFLVRGTRRRAHART
jgi:hypothetical protein